MTFVFGPDWYVEDDYPELLTISRKGNGFSVAFNIVNDASLFDPLTGGAIPFPRDFATWLRTTRTSTRSRCSPVKVAGIDGLQIDATPIWRSTTARIKRFLAVNSRVTWNLVTLPEKWRFIVLDNVEGQRVLILMIAPAPDKFDAALPEARQILDKVRIGRPAKVLAEWKLSMPVGFAFGFGCGSAVPSHRDPNPTAHIDPVSNKVVALIQGTGSAHHEAVVVGD